MPLLIAGLGNPGSQYDYTPHNIGFQVIDVLAARWGAPPFTAKFDSLFTQLPDKVFLMKPTTYMNLSGRAVQAALAFYKLDPASEVLVVSDEMDLPPGKLRLRLSGSAGGHNGLKSIIELLGGENFP